MKALILLTTFIASTTIQAVSIVPNIQRNGWAVGQSRTGAATAFSDRKNASLFFSTGENKDDDASKSDTSQSLSALVNYSHEKYSIQAIGGKTEYKDGETKEKEKYGTLLVGLGYKLNEKTALGFDIIHFDFGSGESNTLGLSSTTRVRGDIFAGGFITTNNNANSKRFISKYPSTETYNIGVGVLKQNELSAEAVLTYIPEKSYSDSGSKFKTSDSKKLSTEIVYLMEKIEISGSLSYNLRTTKYSSTDTEEKELEFAIGSEYQITPTLFLFLNLNTSKYEYVDNDDKDNSDTQSTTGITPGLRLRKGNKQLYLSYRVANTTTDYEDGSDDEKGSSKDINLAFTYFF